MPRGYKPRTPKEPKAPVVYEVSDVVRSVAQRLIKLYPVQFGWTLSFNIGYILIHGQKLDLEKREPWGKFKKVPPLYRGITTLDAVVELNADGWDRLTAEQQEALVAHELCHGTVSDKGALRVVPHDLEEFRFVVAQWGAWDDSIRRFGEQLDLFSSNGPIIKTGTRGEQTKVPLEQEPIENFRTPPIVQ